MRIILLEIYVDRYVDEGRDLCFERIMKWDYNDFVYNANLGIL